MNNVVDGRNQNSATRRAPRYTIEAPVRFRTDRGEWLEGTTVNICSQGLLIRTRRPPVPTTSLEVQVALTGSVTSGAHVTCEGRVLRTEPGSQPGEVLFAVTIEHFELRPATDWYAPDG